MFEDLTWNLLQFHSKKKENGKYKFDLLVFGGGDVCGLVSFGVGDVDLVSLGGAVVVVAGFLGGAVVEVEVGAFGFGG